MSPPTLPAELIEAIIDQVALLSSAEALAACALTSRAFVFQSQKHIFHTIYLDQRWSRGVDFQRFHHILLANPYLGAHVRHLHLVDDIEDDFARESSWITHKKTHLDRTLGFLPHLHSFSLSLSSGDAEWRDVPDETRAAFGRVFKMESVNEVELEFVYGFPRKLLVSFCRLRYLALSNVDLEESDAGVNSITDLSKVSLEGVYLRGSTPRVIRTLTKTLSSAVEPTLCKLALTPTYEGGFSEAVAELIMACGSRLTSFAWLPSIHFRSTLGPINLSTLQHLRTLHFIVNFRPMSSHKPFAHLLAVLLQIADRSEGNIVEKISLECHCITPRTRRIIHGKESLARIWKPLNEALSATSKLELDSARSKATFSKLTEVEVVLSASTIDPAEISWIMARKAELLPSVEARGVIVNVKVERGLEEKGLLHRLREM